MKRRVDSTFAGLGASAAAAAQAAVTARIPWSAGWPGTAAENRAAMRVRRSLTSMSSKAGSVFSPYQGWSSPRASMSAGSWPCRAYHTTIRVWISSANGTVRSTARRVRLRASPAPSTLRAPANACSTGHLIAYRDTIRAGAGGCGAVGGDQRQVVAAGGVLVADQDHGDGPGVE